MMLSSLWKRLLVTMCYQVNNYSCVNDHASEYLTRERFLRCRHDGYSSSVARYLDRFLAMDNLLVVYRAQATAEQDRNPCYHASSCKVCTHAQELHGPRHDQTVAAPILTSRIELDY